MGDPHVLARIRDALGAAYEITDHDDFAQITDREGNHVGLVGFEPLQLEVELSVVFLDSDRELDELVDEAHDMLTRIHGDLWAPQGFRVAESGEVHEGEAVDDPEMLISSYELPTTTRARSPEHVAELVAWVRAQEADFIL